MGRGCRKGSGGGWHFWIQHDQMWGRVGRILSIAFGVEVGILKSRRLGRGGKVWTESCWKGFGKAWPSPLEIYRVVLGWGWVEIGADKHYGWGQGWNWVKSSAGDGVGMRVGLEMG